MMCQEAKAIMLKYKRPPPDRLAAEFKVSTTTIKRILSGSKVTGCWSHIK